MIWYLDGGHLPVPILGPQFVDERGIYPVDVDIRRDILQGYSEALANPAVPVGERPRWRCEVP